MPWRNSWVRCLILIAVIWFSFGSQGIAASCRAGTIEVGREDTDRNTIIYCKRIKDLGVEEVRSLSCDAISSLSMEDRKGLRIRRHELGIEIIVSPSLIISPEERDFLQRRLTELKVKRERMDKELENVRRSRETIDQAAVYNAQVIHDLTADSYSHALNVLEGGLYLYGGKVPGPTMDKIKVTLTTANTAVDGYAAATSEPDSERQALKLMETGLDLKNLVSAQVIGMDSEEWKAISEAVDTFPKLIETSQRIASTPHDKSLWREWRLYLDDFLASSGKFCVPVRGVHSAVQLLRMKGAFSSLKNDRNDLQEAGVVTQTAQRYWITRIGEVKELEKFYKTRLAAGAAVEDELGCL